MDPCHADNIPLDDVRPGMCVLVEGLQLPANLTSTDGETRVAYLPSVKLAGVPVRISAIQLPYIVLALPLGGGSRMLDTRWPHSLRKVSSEYENFFWAPRSRPHPPADR